MAGSGPIAALSEGEFKDFVHRDGDVPGALHQERASTIKHCIARVCLVEPVGGVLGRKLVCYFGSELNNYVELIVCDGICAHTDFHARTALPTTLPFGRACEASTAMPITSPRPGAASQSQPQGANLPAPRP